MLGIGGTLSGWRCIPCGSSNFGKDICAGCGRHHDDATDANRWKRFLTLDAEIVAEEEDCPHDHVLKDDDGRDNWFYVCDDCDKVVELSEPDEDGKSYWEVIE